MPPEEYELDENEERSMIEPKSLEDPKLKELILVLIDWINDELADQRIIVKDIVEDLYDGQVLQKLLEKLTGEKLDVPEVTQSEEGQKQKLTVVLSTANRVLDRYHSYKWNVESIHSKNIVAILHLLVGLARQFRAPVRLPERVAAQVVVVRKKDGQLIHKTIKEEITSTYDDLGMRCERDAFDTLFDHPADKLAVVKKSLISFVNKHLSKVHLEVTDLDTQFHDGVFLTLLLGLLEGFFVPLGSFHLTPRTHDQKVHNVSFAFDIMQDIGLPKPKARPEDIVNLDLKSTLRVLYNLFTKYKSMN
ncbi:beta-parvin-like isoform X2 [Xylocopa sonorina]